MEDLYVKPGNQERGWNDPPQFSYGLQRAKGPQRSLLSRRPPPPDGGTPPPIPGAPPPGHGAPPPVPGAPPTGPPLFSPRAPPPCDMAASVEAPPLNPPPLRGVATPPTPLAPAGSPSAGDSGPRGAEPAVEDVLAVLQGALAACRHSVSAQVCNDVEKRLRLLEDSWRTGRLSLPVRRRMDGLSHELQTGRWDSADEVHRSLMVDHVTEVSQWMVGVKRLIAETRKLSPELLEPFLRPAEPGPEPEPGPGPLPGPGPEQDSA